MAIIGAEEMQKHLWNARIMKETESMDKPGLIARMSEINRVINALSQNVGSVIAAIKDGIEDGAALKCTGGTKLSTSWNGLLSEAEGYENELFSWMGAIEDQISKYGEQDNEISNMFLKEKSSTDIESTSSSNVVQENKKQSMIGGKASSFATDVVNENEKGSNRDLRNEKDMIK